MATCRSPACRIEEATPSISAACAASVERHELTLLVGGNNAVTRPGVHALGLPLDKVGLITLDAHFDMRDTSAGPGNGNPVRALREDGLPGGISPRSASRPSPIRPKCIAMRSTAGI